MKKLTLVAVAVLFAGFAMADRIEFVNGAVIQGKVKEMREAKLLVEWEGKASWFALEKIARFAIGDVKASGAQAVDASPKWERIGQGISVRQSNAKTNGEDVTIYGAVRSDEECALCNLTMILHDAEGKILAMKSVVLKELGAKEQRVYKVSFPGAASVFSKLGKIEMQVESVLR